MNYKHFVTFLDCPVLSLLFFLDPAPRSNGSTDFHACFKIILFREQFKLTAEELKNLTEFCLFVSHVYVQAWISCPLACHAPVNDLLLYRHKQYDDINKAVADAALKKLNNHLWYVGPEMAHSRCFLIRLQWRDKGRIVERMQQCNQDLSVCGIRLKNCADLHNKELHELVTPASSCTLELLQLDRSFIITNDPETWDDSPVYMQNKSIVSLLKVVNDIAERFTALMSD